MDKLILASSSPRRRTLLEQFNIKFDIVNPDFPESDVSTDSAEKMARLIAEGKALSVGRRFPEAIVIAADTIVVMDDVCLGKPKSKVDAITMLKQLSGRTHHVVTGLTVCQLEKGHVRSSYERTEVTFGPLTDDLINRYVESGEPLDKAGAYGIQGVGAIFVRKLSGCYYNVVGLPLYTLRKMLEEVDVNLI